jgi:DNA-binding IclR family transcriptional regulator
MHELHQQLGETVNLSVRHSDAVIYIERMASDKQMMRVVQIIGAQAPLHITAVGKIFLAADGPDKCAEYAKRSGLPGYTANTLTDAARFMQEVDSCASKGRVRQ